MVLSACSPSDSSKEEVKEEAKHKIVGTWEFNAGGMSVYQTYSSDGTFRIMPPGEAPQSGTWSIKDAQLTIAEESGESMETVKILHLDDVLLVYESDQNGKTVASTWKRVKAPEESRLIGDESAAVQLSGQVALGKIVDSSGSIAEGVEPDFVTDTASLSTELVRNGAAFKEKYKGKVVEIRGRILEIQSDGDLHQVNLGVETQDMRRLMEQRGTLTFCVFQNNKPLLRLRKDQGVSILGVFDRISEVRRIPVFVRCRIDTRREEEAEAKRKQLENQREKALTPTKVIRDDFKVMDHNKKPYKTFILTDANIQYNDGHKQFQLEGGRAIQKEIENEVSFSKISMVHSTTTLDLPCVEVNGAPRDGSASTYRFFLSTKNERDAFEKTLNEAVVAWRMRFPDQITTKYKRGW